MVERQAADAPAAVLGSTRRGAQRRCQQDPEPMKARSHTDDVSQCGLWGGVSGRAEVGERWEAGRFVPGQGESRARPPS